MCLLSDVRTPQVQYENRNAGAVFSKFGDSHLLKRYDPELLAGIIFDVYD